MLTIKEKLTRPCVAGLSGFLDCLEEIVMDFFGPNVKISCFFLTEKGENEV